MPGGDRTGPMGMGARTGRAAGLCSGAGVPGYANRGFGRGRGMGFGRGGGGWGRGMGGGGRGWRNMFFATGLPGWMRFGNYTPSSQNSDPEMEKQELRSQAEALQSELDSIKKRLSEIEK
ncbi:hypothetical protein EHM69_10660 [candidate division KSB1 bacterium]|nr:MAG: hypothetical protein EHM69_10660 [candidate division KSB1 bacterium]